MNPNPFLRGGATPSNPSRHPSAVSLGSAKGNRLRRTRNPDDPTYRPPRNDTSDEDDYEYDYEYDPAAVPEEPEFANPRPRSRTGSGPGPRRLIHPDDPTYRPSADSGDSDDDYEFMADGVRRSSRRRRSKKQPAPAPAPAPAKARARKKTVPRRPTAPAGVATPPATPRPVKEEYADDDDESLDEDYYDDEGYEPEPHPALLHQHHNELGARVSAWFGNLSSLGDFLGRGGESRNLAAAVAGGDGWAPARKRFREPWSKSEYETEWYEAVYWNLFVRVRQFAEEYFGGGDIPGVPVVPPVGGGGGERGFPWLEGGFPWLEGGFSKEFMWFVEKVAIQDNNVGGWDALLRRGAMRECLVTGVIAKLLETSVFDQLLFGADKTQKTMLESQDECTLQFEGYQRTNLRAQFIRTLLVGEIVTAEFWPCVDQLAYQTTSLLVPLLRLMDKHFPKSQTKSLRNMYQDLHTIIAEAGYLSIGMRWSSNIFRLSSPSPGEVWDLGQEHIEPELYEMSEAVNKRADRLAEATWREKLRRQYRQQREREAQPSAETLRGQEAVINSALSQVKGIWRRVTGLEIEEHSDDEGDGNDVWHPASRMGKVQIILWPMLQRFQTVGGIDAETGVADGETITTVVKSQVVYYFGRIDNHGDQSDDFPTLGDWVQKNKRDRRFGFLVPLRWVAYAIGVWLLLSFVGRYISIIDDLLQVVLHGLITVVTYIAREVILFVLEILITLLAFVIGIVKIFMYLAYVVGDLLSRPFLFGLRLIGRAFGDIKGMQGWVNGLGGQYDTGVEYPNLSWGSLKALARAVTGDVIWRRVTVEVPVGYTRP